MFRDQASSIVERPVTFGRDVTLVGIESSSVTSRAHAGRPAVILLNAGLIHRVGPNRLHVTISRRLAAAGYPSLRFDLSGRGDSEARTDALPFLVSSVAESGAAMDYLQSARGINRFVLMGICSGAVNALQAAMADARVVGAVVIDAPAYPTRGYYLRYYLKRLGSVESWRNTLTARNALGRKLLGKRAASASARDGADNADDFGVPDTDGRIPARDEAARALEDLVGRGTRLLVIYSGTWSAYNYRNQFRDTFPGVMKHGAVKVEYFPDADHTFTRVANQQRLVGTIARWVTTSWPVGAGRSAVAPADGQDRTPGLTYSVQLTPFDEAEPAVVRITEDNLPPGAERGQRYQWFYRANPAGPGDVFLLTSGSPDGRSEAIGCTGLGPRRFLYRGRTVRAALSADFAVDRAHRTVLPALRLQEAAAERAASHYDLAYGFPNASARGVFLRLGFTELGRMARYVKVLRYEPYLQRHSSTAWLAARGAAFLDRLEVVRERRQSAEVPRALEFDWLQDFDSRFDDLVAGLAAATPIVGERNVAWLRWRFGDASGSVGAIAALTDAGSGEIRAYAVVAPKEPGIARIADFAGLTPQDVSHLLARLVPELRFQGFGSVVVTFLGPAWVGELLTRQGFHLRDAERSVVVKSTSPDHADFFRPEHWYLTAADSDT